MLYFGKLRKHREFLYAEKLKDVDRWFLDSWYSRCRNVNSLMPFLNKKQNTKTWLFMIISNHKIYLGLTSLSEDLSGRQYPFTCFDTLPILEVGGVNDPLLLTQYFMDYTKKASQFIRLIQDGRLNQELLSFLTIKDTEFNVALPPELNVFVEHIVLDPASNIEDKSCWLEIKTNFFISHQNSLTCSLYNKIYG